MFPKSRTASTLLSGILLRLAFLASCFVLKTTHIRRISAVLFRIGCVYSKPRQGPAERWQNCGRIGSQGTQFLVRVQGRKPLQNNPHKSKLRLRKYRDSGQCNLQIRKHYESLQYHRQNIQYSTILDSRRTGNPYHSLF